MTYWSHGITVNYLQGFIYLEYNFLERKLMSFCFDIHLTFFNTLWRSRIFKVFDFGMQYLQFLWIRYRGLSKPRMSQHLSTHHMFGDPRLHRTPQITPVIFTINIFKHGYETIVDCIDEKRQHLRLNAPIFLFRFFFAFICKWIWFNPTVVPKISRIIPMFATRLSITSDCPAFLAYFVVFNYLQLDQSKRILINT